MLAMDQRIRITEDILVGVKNGVDIHYIEGAYPKDENDPVVLPTEDIATGSFLEEVETGMVKQFTEATSEWIDQGTIQTTE